MRRHHLLIILSGFFIVALIAAGSFVSGSELWAMQQSTNGAAIGQGQDSQSGQGNNVQGNNDRGTNNSAVDNGAASGTQDPGMNGSQTGTYNGTGTAASPGTTDQQAQQDSAANQSGAGTARAGAPWGWMIGSFIVGLIVGGLAFSRKVYRDRDDLGGNIRRAA